MLQGIEKMRASGKLAARVLEYAGTLIKPGITTDEIDKAVSCRQGAGLVGCMWQSAGMAGRIYRWEGGM